MVEDNLIVNCGRGIGFGLTAADETRSYADDPYPGVGYVGHHDGIIRNNAIFADIAGFDSGIALAQARGVRVFHNTIYSTGGFSSIEYRFANTVAEVRNNLTRNIVPRDGATATLGSNLESVPASYFVDAARGDLHLSASATDAIDRGAVVSEAGVDLDGNAHGTSPDLGAYEYRP